MSKSSPHTAVVGLQWGDEGKGKVVDLLTAEHDIVIRYNGGANAGHTVVIHGEKYALHLVPSGMLEPNVQCVIGNGVVVDPGKLLEEIESLQQRGIKTEGRLLLSSRAHVVMPYHKMLDAALEEFLAKRNGRSAIGTTRRGIGPAYADKVLRSPAVRVGDLTRPTLLRERVELACDLHTKQLTALGSAEFPDVESVISDATAWGEQLGDSIIDSTWFLNDAVADGKRLLFEGANACLLDVDHGTYPFVTSSNCSTLGIPAGTGLPPRTVDRVMGIMKAYATRVGAGAFPTEQDNEVGEAIRARGKEFGTTTGRPRRCGWLDLVAVRYTTMLSGTTAIACMLFDVLDGLDELKICTAYRLPDGTLTDRFPPDAATLDDIEPIYETFEGWSGTDNVSEREQLPAAAQRYLSFIESTLGLPIELLSVGPDRSQTIMCNAVAG